MHGENTRTHSDYGKVAAPKAQTFALELAPQISSPKPTATVKKRDLRDEENCVGFSLLLQLLETSGAGCGDNADEGGPSFCGSLAPEP